jgi:hypothetical protein
MKSITFLNNAEIISWPIDKSILSTDTFLVTWGNNTVPAFVYITGDYVKQQNIEYKIAKFEDIDKSNPWLIFVAVNFPFLNINDKEMLASKQLFQGIPDNIINELVYGNAYLIISFEQESYTKTFLDLFYSLYKNNPIVPANKLIHITAAYNIHEIYENYRIVNNIADTEKIQMWFSPHSLLGPVRYFANQYVTTKVNKVKKFINFNRSPRSHRVAFTSLLAEYDLLDNGYVSLGSRETVAFKTNADILTYIRINFPEIYKFSINGNIYKLILSGCEKLIKLLPLTIDTDDFTYGPTFGYSGDLMDFYNKSYFSIVSSTYYFSIDENAITLNEKEYKPILAKHPFILVSAPGTLALLKTLGFKTFDKWFDERYDNETNDEDRMLKLINEVNRLCKIDNITWNNMLEEMQPILEHNFNWITTNRDDIIFRSDLKHILEYAK